MSKRVREMDNIITHCLKQIEAGNWSLEDCEKRYPASAPTLRIVMALREVGRIEPDEAFRKASLTRLQNRLRARPLPPAVQQPGRLQGVRPRWVRVATAAALVLVILAAALSGTAVTANAAAPGDALYPLDLAVERLQIALTKSSEKIVHLQLQFGEERLREARHLARSGDTTLIAEALGKYNEALAQVVSIGASVPSSADDTLAVYIDDALSQQTEQIQQLEAELGLPDEGHPVGIALATQYQIPYDDIMAWAQSGFGFGEISLALETSKISGESVDAILASRAAHQGWGQIWRHGATQQDEFPASQDSPTPATDADPTELSPGGADDAATDPDQNTAQPMGENLPPVVSNDLFDVTTGNAQQLYVLANDHDPDGTLDTASLSIVSPPQRGIIQTINPNSGMILYKGDKDSSGSDSFVYQVCDTEGACTSGMVTINIVQNNR